MNARQARAIRQGVQLAQLRLDPVVGNVWYSRLAVKIGGLTYRAFHETIMRTGSRAHRELTEVLLPQMERNVEATRAWLRENDPTYRD